MPKRKLSNAHYEAIDVLAHCLVISEIDKHVPGFNGLFKKHIDSTIDAQQRQIWHAFTESVTKTRKDFAVLLAEESTRA